MCAHERVFSANYIDWKVHAMYITKTMNGHLTNIIVQVSQFNANENVVKCLLRFLLSRVK